MARPFPHGATTSLQFDDAGTAVLARANTQSRILDRTYDGEAEVHLDLSKAGIYVCALFASEEASGPFMHAASDPRNLSDLIFDGKPIEGFATEARLVNT